MIEKLSPSGAKKELVKQRLQIPSFLKTNTYQWNGRLLFTGEKEGAAAVLGELKNGQFHVHNLNELKLPARPVSIDVVMNSFRGQTPFPMFELTLKNDQKAYVSGISNEKHQLGVYVSKSAEPFSLIEDKVVQQLQKRSDHHKTLLSLSNPTIQKDQGKWMQREGLGKSSQHQNRCTKPLSTS